MNRNLLLSKKKAYYLLGIIVFIAFFLRVYGIGSLPASLYWDEVAIAYNAFSISETLKDEYGNFLPILFRSYDDYKMPLYIYVLTIPVKIFGFNEFATRLPSAIFGTLTVLLTFFLVKKLFEQDKIKYFLPSLLALLSSLLMAISPWHIQFSRGAFEANAALFFVVLGTACFLIGIKKFSYLSLAFVAYALAFYSYRSIFVFLPILIIGLLFFYRRELSRFGRVKLLFLLVGFVVVVLPITHAVFFQGGARASQTSIANEVDEIALQRFEEGRPIDRRILYPYVLTNNYIKTISPEFLFLSGDPNPRHSPEDVGMLYLWEAPFLLIGLFALYKFTSFRTKGVFIIWLFAAILPAALTTPAPHALRSLNILPIPQILIAMGVVLAGKVIPRKMLKPYFVIVSVLVVGFLLQFIFLYQRSYSINSVTSWGDGYKQLYSYLISNEQKYDSVVVTGEYWQPYAYALFYKKYDPQLFQERGSAAGFDKYYFGGTSWDGNVARPQLKDVDLRDFGRGESILVALSPSEYNVQKENVIKLHEIKDLKGKTVFITGVVK